MVSDTSVFVDAGAFYDGFEDSGAEIVSRRVCERPVEAADGRPGS